MNVKPDKLMSDCCDNEGAFRILQAAQTTSPLVRQFQRAFMSFPPSILLDTFGAETFWYMGNEITNELAKEGSVHLFIGQEPSLGLSRHNMKKIKIWLVIQPALISAAP
jgi:hypothetical protein